MPKIWALFLLVLAGERSTPKTHLDHTQKVISTAKTHRPASLPSLPLVQKQPPRSYSWLIVDIFGRFQKFTWMECIRCILAENCSWKRVCLSRQRIQLEIFLQKIMPFGQNRNPFVNIFPTSTIYLYGYNGLQNKKNILIQIQRQQQHRQNYSSSKTISLNN